MSNYRNILNPNTNSQASIDSLGAVRTGAKKRLFGSNMASVESTIFTTTVAGSGTVKANNG